MAVAYGSRAPRAKAAAFTSRCRPLRVARINTKPELVAHPRRAGKTMSKVLIVDDNRAGRDLVRAILKGSPYEIVEASHGQEALERIRQERPDLVLLDIDMPLLDGFAVVRHIRQDERLADLPVV